MVASSGILSLILADDRGKTPAAGDRDIVCIVHTHFIVLPVWRRRCLRRIDTSPIWAFRRSIHRCLSIKAVVLLDIQPQMYS